MNTCSLLIIDDNAPYGPILRHLLPEWDVHVVTDIASAQAWILERKATIMIVDEDVNGAAGSAFVAALLPPRPYVVAHSLHTEERIRQQYREHGATFNSFIQKPISGRLLAQRLRDIQCLL